MAFHRKSRRSLLLVAALLPVAAQSAVETHVIHAFEPSTVGPFAPPVWEPQRQALVGTTQSGGDAMEMVAFSGGTVGSAPAGLAYSLGIDGSDYLSVSLGGAGGMPITNAVATPAGKVVAGASFAAWTNPADGIPYRVGALFELDTALAATAYRPADATTLGKFQARGQLAIDTNGNVYVGNGYGDSTTNRLERLTPAGVVETVVNFDDYRKTFEITSRGVERTWPSKGNLPYAQVWSARDNALYLVSAVAAWSGTKPTCLAGEPAEGLSKPDCDDGSALTGHLLRISGDAIERGVEEDDIEILFHFTALTGGVPSSNDGALAALIEDGDYLYGTTLAGPSGSAAGGVWRIRKAGLAEGQTSEETFQFAHVFAPNLSAARTDYVPAEGEAAIEGSGVFGPLVRAADGAIYGTTPLDDRTVTVTTSSSRAAGAGTIFRIMPGTAADRSDDAYEVVHLLDAASVGSVPHGLSVGPSIAGLQHIVGVTTSGATSVFGFTVPVPPGSVTLASSAGDSTVDAGTAVTLTWTTEDIASCTASASSTEVTDWSGDKSASGGEQSVTARTGDIDYTLDCTDIGGSPVSTSVRLKAAEPVVTTPVDEEDNSGGGGGAISWLLLAGLGLIGLGRRALR